MNMNRAEQEEGARPQTGPPSAPLPVQYYAPYPAYPAPPMFPMGNIRSFVQPAPAANQPTLGPHPGTTFRIEGDMPQSQYAKSTGSSRHAPNQRAPPGASPATSRSAPRKGASAPAPAAQKAWKWGEPQGPRK